VADLILKLINLSIQALDRLGLPLVVSTLTRPPLIPTLGPVGSADIPSVGILMSLSRPPHVAPAPVLRIAIPC